MEKVARGTTIGIVKISQEISEWLRQMRSLITRDFTGRIEGILRKDKNEAEFVLEITSGKIVGAWLKDFDGKITSGLNVLDKIFDWIKEVEEGYIEITELDESGVSLDLEYNKDIVLDREVHIDDLLDSFIENRKIWRIEELFKEKEQKEVEVPPAIEETKTEEKEEKLVETEEYKEVVEKLIPEWKIESVSESEKEYAKRILNELSGEARQVGKGQDRLFNVLSLLLALSGRYERPLILVSRIGDEAYVILAENGKIKGAYRIDELSLQILEWGAKVLKRLAMLESVPYTIYEVEIKGEGMLGGFKRLLKKLFGTR